MKEIFKNHNQHSGLDPILHVQGSMDNYRTNEEMIKMYLEIDEILKQNGFEIVRISSDYHYSRLLQDAEAIAVLRQVINR